MVDKLKQMNYELYMVSRHRSLIITKYYIFSALAFAFFYASAKAYPLIPLNIIISYLLLLLFNKVLFLNRQIKSEDFLLTTLIEKYHYTTQACSTNSNAFTAFIVVLMFWQLMQNKRSFPETFYSIYPCLLIVSSLILRIVFFIFYRFKLQRNLENNRL